MLGLHCKSCLKKTSKMPKPVSAFKRFKFAFPLLCFHIYDGQHRDFISKRAAVGWCCRDIRKGVLCTMFSPKKINGQKTAVVFFFNLFPVTRFSLPNMERLNLFKEKTLRTACSVNTLPSPLPLASHLAAD